MEDDRHPAEEPIITRILEVARSGIVELRKDDKLRRQLQTLAASIVAGCNELDEKRNWHEITRYLEAVEAAFAIGAICGKPSDASLAGAGRKGRGGRAQGQKAKERSTSYKISLKPIFQELRSSNPTWLDAKLIREARKTYGDQLPVLPGDRQLANYLAEMIADGIVLEGPKDGRSKKVLKRAS